ncbi:type II secretion system F family protein [Desulfofundulus thermosubterraneus]|uniref:Tight adherence protein B n=1 Tax=Desulfofundulus thermosubterraneus DSM 16057 TaxID=1121432 RepID=A0A1M6AE15_9FIRM|nr:type II secretion system F family protein [Desulfofundulus thermosubterraneus]SHI34804.1 tight adherence protein B [Desulfofundulus thermosubterraneus DSM 16057]
MDLKVIALFTFLAVALLAPGLQQLILARKKFITDRLKELAGRGGRGGNGRMEKINQDLRHNFFKSLLAHAGRLSPRVLSMAADRRLAEADLPFKGEEFIALAAFCAAGGGVIAVALTGRPELAVLAALAAGAAPFWLVKAIAKRRVMLFNGQIADTLLIMANSLRAGFSFMQAIEVVQREMPPPIGREFGRTFRELSLGTPVEEALTSLVKRVKSEDLSLVVTAVLVQRQVGGNLAFNAMTTYLTNLFRTVHLSTMEMAKSCQLILSRTESYCSTDGKDQKEVAELAEINNAARRLARVVDRLNSLSLQFKITN